MKTRISRTLIAVAMAAPVVAQAGGMHFYEMGTTDLGLAAAGQAARAEDASTVYGNPAGMTRLAGNHLSVGGLVVYADAEYKRDADKPGAWTGNDPGNVGGPFGHLSTFYSHSVSDRFKLGLGIYGNYGLALDFGRWAGSQLVEDVSTKAVSFQPTAAYRVNDQWSVGGGMIMSYGFTKLERRQSGVKITEDDQDWSYGWRLGVMYEPTATTRVGFVWQSKIEHEYDMNWSAANPLTVYARMLEKSVRPEDRMLSVWQRVSPAWAVMGNIGWQGWSKYTNDGLQNRSYNGPLEFRDTWHVAIGAQYTINANTKWNIGTAYDTSMYKSQKDTALILPNGAVWRIGTGIQYKMNKNDELGIAVAYLRAESGYDQHPRLAGEYDHPQIYFASVQYLYKF